MLNNSLVSNLHTATRQHAHGISITVSALLGAWFAFHLYGWSVINPTNVHWLLTEGDPFQHFIGWDAFRRDEWRWPLGALPQFGTLIDSSIVFTDSIPLFALPLKVLHPFLPDPFQYQGLVMLMNLMLNAAVACGVALRLGGRPIPAILFSVLILILPIVTMRGLGAHGHEALTAHWLILLALGLAVTARDSTASHLQWLALLLLGVLVHFYLFFMVGTLWAAWWLSQLLSSVSRRDMLGGIRLGSTAGINIAAVLGSMWAMGYFQYGLDVGQETGFGYFSAEWLTFINPLSEAWFFKGTELHGASRVLPGWTTPIAGQYEGQAYAGLGALIFFLAALLAAVRRVQRKELQSVGRQTWLVALALLGLFLFGLSDRWVIGLLVWDVPYPGILDPLAQYLRSSGRLVWPLLYGLLLAGFAYLAHQLKQRTLLCLLGVACLVQWADLKPFHHFISEGLAARVASVDAQLPYEALNDPRVESALEGRTAISYLPGDDLGRLKPYLWLAVRNDLSLNVAYYARVNPDAIKQATSPEVERISQGHFSDEHIYVLAEDSLAQTACQYEELNCFEVGDMAIGVTE